MFSSSSWLRSCSTSAKDCRSASSACLRPVTSTETPRIRDGFPGDGGCIRPREWIQRTVSSGSRIRYSRSTSAPSSAARRTDSRTISRDSGSTNPRNSSMLMSTSGEKPKSSRPRSFAQKRPLAISSIHIPTPADLAARCRRSSLSRRIASDRPRTSALAKICATSCSRWTSSSGQLRSSRMVLKPRTPTIGSPPADSGKVSTDLTPKWRHTSRSRAASGGSSSSDEKATIAPSRSFARHHGKYSRASIGSGRGGPPRGR